MITRAGGHLCAGPGRVPDYPSEIVAVVARHVGAVLWPTNKISIFTGHDHQS